MLESLTYLNNQLINEYKLKYPIGLIAIKSNKERQLLSLAFTRYSQLNALVREFEYRNKIMIILINNQISNEKLIFFILKTILDNYNYISLNDTSLYLYFKIYLINEDKTIIFFDFSIENLSDLYQLIKTSYKTALRELSKIYSKRSLTMITNDHVEISYQYSNSVFHYYQENEIQYTKIYDLLNKYIDNFRNNSKKNSLMKLFYDKNETKKTNEEKAEIPSISIPRQLRQIIISYLIPPSIKKFNERKKELFISKENRIKNLIKFINSKTEFNQTFKNIKSELNFVLKKITSNKNLLNEKITYGCFNNLNEKYNNVYGNLEEEYNKLIEKYQEFEKEGIKNNLIPEFYLNE